MAFCTIWILFHLESALSVLHISGIVVLVICLLLVFVVLFQLRLLILIVSHVSWESIIALPFLLKSILRCSDFALF